MATIRLEQRYLIPTDRCEAISRLTNWDTILHYSCTNLYFDDGSGSFSQTRPGSPRLRLRLYRAGELCFGNLELKRVAADGDTEKHRWPIEVLWSEYQERISELRQVALNPPPAGSPFSFLVLQSHNGTAFPQASLCIGRLSYERISLQSGELRVSIDSGFDPHISPRGYNLLECKSVGSHYLVEEIKTIPGILPSAESKFVMFSKVNGWR